MSVDALSCPRCSSRERSVPLVVLALLSDPEVVGRILRHLGLPALAPTQAAARPSGRVLGFDLAEDGGGSEGSGHDGDGEPGTSALRVRPPP
jgi:hypothetical protein